MNSESSGSGDALVALTGAAVVFLINFQNILDNYANI